MKNAVRFTVVLGLITIAAGLGVSAVYQLTRGRIDAKKEKAFAAALSEVFPEADRFVAAGSEDPWQGEGVGVALKGAETGGYLAVGEKQGYSSKIRVLVGARSDLSIKAVRILEQAETPGLGERTKEVRTDRTVWRAAGEAVGAVEKTAEPEDTTPWFQKQFEGLTLEKLVVVKDSSEDGIQAITGATISSQAVTDAVKAALSLIAAEVGGVTGAESDEMRASDKSGQTSVGPIESGEHGEGLESPAQPVEPVRRETTSWGSDAEAEGADESEGSAGEGT